MAIASKHPVNNSVLMWLRKMGIDTTEVLSVTLQFSWDAAVVVTIERFANKEDIEGLSDVLDEVVRERYTITQKAVE